MPMQSLAKINDILENLNVLLLNKFEEASNIPTTTIPIKNIQLSFNVSTNIKFLYSFVYTLK